MEYVFPPCNDSSFSPVNWSRESSVSGFYIELVEGIAGDFCVNLSLIGAIDMADCRLSGSYCMLVGVLEVVTEVPSS